MSRALLATLLLPAALAACGSAPPRLDARAYPGTLHAPSHYPGDFFARQHIDAQRGERQISFDAVLQKRGDTLVLIALTPYGSRAFVVEQRGDEIRFTSSISGELPFPPSFVLLDVHRALLAGLPRATGSSLADGTHVAEIDGERIQERWLDAHMLERRFTRVDGVPAGDIVVRYGGDGLVADGTPTGVITLTNGWLGYLLRITTTEHRSLPSVPQSH